MILKEVPHNERPREKLLSKGIESLSNAELLAIIIQSGTPNKNALDIATDIIYSIPNLSMLANLSIKELMENEGIGLAKAISIVAAVELGKRVILEHEENLKLNNSENVFKYFYPIISNYHNEVLFCIFYDLKGKVITIKKMSEGGYNSTIIDSMMIFKWAFKLSSKSIILVHNHPSGDPTPSLNDLRSTKELKYKAKILNINIIDHVIIGNSYYSMKNELNNFD